MRKNGPPISRRDALKTLGALAGATAVPRILGGCGDEAREPGKITTIVMIMMENRSYDHYLGARGLLEGKPGDGLVATMGNPDMGGVMRPVYREEVDCIADPPHGWDASRAQLNGGACDGFVKAYQQRIGPEAAPYPVGYFGREEQPVLWGLADAFTSCDRWFSSLLGPTWPNRLYMHAATSGGMIENKLPPDGLYSFPTIWDRLNAAGIDWRYYFSDIPFMAILKGIPAEKMKRMGIEFFNDVAGGKLPPVTLLDPGFGSNDDHPPHHPIMGQQLLGAIYAALRASPQWNEMLFVITYDEHGGFYDHVAPGKVPDERAAAGFDQLGFRVPSIVAGPWVKKGYVSSVQLEHASFPRHLETMFGLEALTMRDAAANDFSDAIDTARMERGEPLSAPALPAVEVDESMLGAACGYDPINKPDIERAMDAGLLPKELDARPQMRDTLYLLGDVLDKYGAGRIRRGR